MSDQSNQPDGADELPPIPDGGLAHDFPEWLRERPRWASVSAVDADRSTIDPRDLVTLADLPAWLQAIATDPETRLRGVTLPALGGSPQDVSNMGGDPALDTAETEAPAIADDPDMGVRSVETTDQDVMPDYPLADPVTTATTPATPFPNYVTPPAALARPSDAPRSFDPWLIGLIGGAIGIVAATILFLIIQ